MNSHTDVSPDAESAFNVNKESLLKEIEEFLEAYLSEEPTNTTAKVVHDSLWGTLKLTPAEISFIDTPLLQRLRQIRQTGFAYMTYPSTTHSRFEHTLGVILNVKRLGEALIKDSGDRRLTDDDLVRIRIAALLHDIGHGPFSHSSEEIYGLLPQFDLFKNEIPGAKPHEILAYLILSSPRFVDFSKRVFDKFNESRIEPKEIADAIVGISKDPDTPYKHELLNGPFDADKLDYLYRDSHFSGLPLSVDLDRLFYTVRINQSPDRKYRLIVTHSGATSLEQILFSKMVLFTTVYQHHKVRTCDCMFAGIIEYMQEKNISMKTKRRELTWHSPIDYLWITDDEFLSFGFETPDKELHKLIHNLFFRRLLKRALVLSNRTIEKNDDDRWDELQRHAKKTSNAAHERRRLAKDIWEAAGKPCLLQEVWVDLPELPSMKAADTTFVLPGPESDLIPLNELFPTVKWTQKYGQNKWRGHVFCPPDCRQQIGKAAKALLEERYGIMILPQAFHWCKNTPP